MIDILAFKGQFRVVIKTKKKDNLELEISR